MHNVGMRTHRDILREAGHEKVAALTDRPITTVRSWDQRNSIPSTQWRALVDAKLSSVDELLDGVLFRERAPAQGAAA
jgi:hypothetical protein